MYGIGNEITLVGCLGEVNNPVWRNLHSDPRWHALREKAGISEERFAAIQFNPELPP